MSPQAHILKAKLEAVIYAAEEPVTLAQLIGLLGEEAQLELDALDAQQQSLALDDESDPGDPALEPTNDADALNAEILSADTTAAEQQAAAQVSPNETTLPPSVEAPIEAQRDLTIAQAQAAEAISSTEEQANSEETHANAELAAAEEALDATRSARTLAAAAKLRERKLRDYFRFLLDQLIADYAAPARGLEIREVAGGFRLATKPEFHDAVRGFVKSLKPPLKLSLQALETLAVVAYKQPVTAPEVSEIRGVESAGTLGSLMTRKLVTTAGRKQVIGRPILYKTTKDFLVRFGLKDINELPSIEEFEKMAGELNDAVQEEIDMETPTPTEADPAASPDLPAGSPVVDEAHAIPEPTHIHHDTPEDLISDHSTHPEGAKHEPPTDQ
jgi:segregation and condensation protein B